MRGQLGARYHFSKQTCGGEMGEKRSRTAHYCRERQNQRRDDGEEQADVHGLSRHLRPCDVRACAAADGHVWVGGPTTSRGLC